MEAIGRVARLGPAASRLALKHRFPAVNFRETSSKCRVAVLGM